VEEGRLTDTLPWIAGRSRTFAFGQIKWNLAGSKDERLTRNSKTLHHTVHRSAERRIVLMHFQKQAAGKINLQFGCRTSHGSEVFPVHVITHVIRAAGEAPQGHFAAPFSIPVVLSR
jgi:hypothetical protein